MFLDKKGQYSFSIKFGDSNITIPFEYFIMITAGAFLIKFIKIVKTL
jgi:hypothetical protein